MIKPVARAKLYRIDELPKELVSRWNALLIGSAARSPFLSYGFCLANHHAGRRVYALHIRNDDGAEGFVPLQMRDGRSLLGHAQKVGGRMSDYFGMIGNLPADVDMSELLHQVGISALRFDHGVPALCLFAFDEKEDAHGVRVLVEGFPHFTAGLAAQNGKFLKMLYRSERRLEADFGKVEFHWHSQDQAALDHLISVKREQYVRTGVSDGLESSESRALLGRLLQFPSVPYCSAVLSTLHANGQWLASNLSLICGDTMHIWYPCYDPNFRVYSPGHLLFFKTIEHGAAQGMRIFDFGEGVSSYKAEYRGEVYPLWKGVIRGRGFSGRLEKALQSIEWRLQDWSQRNRDRHRGIRESNGIV